ncbi:MAG TPA: serine/threonine-protein kinase [Solirubrobacteraceae bacterium]|nr:serine/threonine-protein kinase [Solirubrobacteraceae bacterium]
MDPSQTPTAAAGATRGRGRSARAGSRASSRQTIVAAPTVPPELVLGRYRLIKRLGSGAFGSVYAGRDERLDRDVAVKLLPRERIVGGRFEREARAAARLSHPAIVTLYEAAVDDDGAYLVSELVRGRTLDEVLSSGRLSDRDILAVGISVCEALEHAHEQGVIHRDVKPSNVLIPARPLSPGHPAKLTDFGVARIVGGDSLTRTGDVVGTLAYMAPEQAEGRECGPAVDLFALALVLYEALTSVNPLRQLRAGGRNRRLAVHLPPLRRQRRDLPRALGAALDQALRPRPSERGEVEDLRWALSSCLEVVGDLQGVVIPGWRGQDRGAEPSEEEPGPEWRDDANRFTRAAGWPAGGASDSLLSPMPLGRGVGAGTAAVSVAWAASRLLGHSPVAPAVVGLVAAVAVLMAPRLGWLICMAALAALAAPAGHAGGALMLALVTGLGALMMWPVSRHFSLPVGAGLLGVLGLAGAWPGLAARASLRFWQRGLLGAAGFVWVAAADSLSVSRIFPSRPALPAASVWTASVPVTLHDVLSALIASGVPVAAAVWAAAAIVGPWLVSARRPVLSLVAVTMWSAATVGAVRSLGPGQLHGAVIGALAGALALLAPSLPALVSRARDQGRPAPRVP